MNTLQRTSVTFMAKSTSLDEKSLKSFSQNPHTWLTAYAKQHSLTYILAHAIDGVIWGLYDPVTDTLTTSHDAAPSISPKILPDTLQQLRLFSEEGGELYLWRTGEDWTGRFLSDEKSDSPMALDEAYVLWGTHLSKEPTSQLDAFTVVADGIQGLRHAVPISRDQLTGFNGVQRPLRLMLRHYLSCDASTGQQFITHTRLRCIAVESMKGASS